MRRLYLLRHAKSSWKQTRLPDHERPLAGRGRRASAAIARHILDRSIAVELVLCSSARRTRETLDLIAPALGDARVVVERELYLASAEDLLARLRSVRDPVGSVLIVGHNPAIQHLARGLARPGPTLLDELAAKYPTGALATLDLGQTPWDHVTSGTAELIGFVRPRDLEPPPVAPPPSATTSRGACGQVRLQNVEPRT